MDLSICILTHNQPTLLNECVEACLSEIATTRVAGEIIIIDNASSNAYPEKLVGLSPLIRIIRNEENRSFSVANNIGIHVSRGRFVLILNDDALLREGSLQQMLQVLESRPDVAAAGPKLLNADGSLQEHFTNRRFPHLLNYLAMVFFLRLEGREWTRGYFDLDRDLDVTAEAEHLAAACLLVRRDALDAVGLFDEGFYYWFEDVDLCYRLRKAGWKNIYLAEAQVTHYGSASIGKLGDGQRAIMFFASQMRYFRKHWSTPKYLFVRLTSALAFLLAIPLVFLRVRCRRLNRKERSVWIRTYLPVARLLLSHWG